MKTKKAISIKNEQISDAKEVTNEKLKSSIIDFAIANATALEHLNQLNFPKNKPLEFKSPEVMSPDGKVTTADKLIAFYDQQIANHTNTQLLNDSNCSPNGALYGINQFTYDNVNQLLIDNVFLGYAEYSLLLQNGLLSSICSTPADKMTAEWIEFVNTSQEEDLTDRIKELEDEFERLNVKEIFNKGAYYTFAFGGCLLYPHLKSNFEDNELYNELYIDSAKVKKGDLEYITIIEPIWYVPIRYVTDNPFSKWFYVPEYYAVMGKICHSTRVLKFMYNEAPNIIKTQYNFNGIPVMQQAIPYVANFKNMTNTITEIIQSLNLLVVKTGLQAIVNGAVEKNPSLNDNAGTALGSRLKALNATRNNLGTLAIDFDNEDVYNLSMQLQTLDKLWSQAAEFMCIVPKLPATEFLGISPQGFNATGSYEQKKYDRHIKSMQEQIFRKNLIKVMHLAMLNIWGEIDRNITFIFKRLDTANELEASAIALNEANEAAVYFDRGIVSDDEVRKKISTQKDSGWNELETEMQNEKNEYTETMPPTENLSGGNYGVKNNPYNITSTQPNI